MESAPQRPRALAPALWEEGRGWSWGPEAGLPRYMWTRLGLGHRSWCGALQWPFPKRTERWMVGVCRRRSATAGPG